MRLSLFLILLVLVGCGDESRIFDENFDFDGRYWPVKTKPTFDFLVETNQTYSIYCNVRNSVSYPYSRIFITYSLADSLGVELKKEMISEFLFDQKTGEPLGTSGLGDIYDHQLLLLKNYTFPKSGKFSIQFEQFMRTDSLQGILAVGLKVEKDLVK